jgi:nicotinamide mononucleotide transporter
MLDVALVLFGAPVTWLEIVAFLLALACVVCNVYEIHWGWPLAFASSLLYAWLFAFSKLYGEAGLQIFFAGTALWGWWQWLFGHRRTAAGGARPLAAAYLAGRGRVAVLLAWLAAWPAMGALLARITDTDVAYFDAFPTVGSVIGQILLGRKYVENWPVWVVVNAVSVVLFAYKSLWLTAGLYILFVLLAVVGWRRWAGAVVWR